MPDEPRRMLPRMPRHQTATERDLSGLAARKERESAVPEPWDDSVTEKYHGIERDEMRARRPTPVRIKLLEDKADAAAKRDEVQERKHDDLVAVVGDVRVDVGQLKTASDDHGKKLDKIDQKLDAMAASRIEFGRRVLLTLIGSGGIALWLLQHYLGGH